MFILFAVHSPPSALVSFIFLEILFPLYSACPSLCPRCHLLIHVKLGKEASRYQNVGIEIHFVCLVNPRFKNKQTNTKKKYPSSVANRLPKPNSTGVNSIGWFSFSFFYFFINSKKSPKIPFLRGDNQFWWKFVYFSVYYSFFFLFRSSRKTIVLASPDGANTNVFRIAVPHTPDDCFCFYFSKKKQMKTLCSQQNLLEG
jgi:hypothetical protein